MFGFLKVDYPTFRLAPCVDCSINNPQYTLVTVAIICVYDYILNDENVAMCKRSIDGLIHIRVLVLVSHED
jgi:hypothetical protein